MTQKLSVFTSEKLKFDPFPFQKAKLSFTQMHCFLMHLFLAALWFVSLQLMLKLEATTRRNDCNFFIDVTVKNSETKIKNRNYVSLAFTLNVNQEK